MINSRKTGFIVTLIISFVATSSQQSTEDPTICYRTLDMVFVVDGSNSLGQDVFQIIKETISNAVDVLTFGTDYARVGAVLYSSQVTNVIDLQTNKADFKTAVAMFEYPDEATYTNLGIDEAVRILTRDRREGVPVAMMIVTDGVSTDRPATMYSALVASSRGIDIWAVGVGDLADMDELEAIARNKTEQTFKIDSFKIFPDRLLNLTRIVCLESETLSTFTIPTTTDSSQANVSLETTSAPPTTQLPPVSSVPPKMEKPDPHTELCKDSPSIGGVGHVLYPGDCTKVLQCYYNPYTNKTLVVTRKCPSGQFWDQTCLKCVDSWKVDCPYDKCKLDCSSGDITGMDSYPMDGICGGFWSCSKGRSYPKCCPPCYSYMAGYGCKFGTTCFDKCGPEEVECADGLGVCEKSPVWRNATRFAVTTDALGLYTTTCSQSDFNIVECRCEVKLMDVFMQNGKECKPYYESNNSLECSGASVSIPVKQKSDIGTLGLRIRINLPAPYFDIISAPSSVQCENPSKLRVWANEDGVHASLGDTTKGGIVTTTLFKNVTGELEILVMLHQGLFTLGVTQDDVQFVSAVKAKSKTMCTDCVHNLTVTSTTKERCLIEKVQLYSCKPELTNIYVVS